MDNRQIIEAEEVSGSALIFFSIKDGVLYTGPGEWALGGGKRSYTTGIFDLWLSHLCILCVTH